VKDGRPLSAASGVAEDNAPWPEAHARFDALRWPEFSGYSSLRLFVAITPATPSTPANFLPESDSINVGLERLLALSAQATVDSDLERTRVLRESCEPIVATQPTVEGLVKFAGVILRRLGSGLVFGLMGSLCGPRFASTSAPPNAIAGSFARAPVRRDTEGS
jgi:hypothetical protein